MEALIAVLPGDGIGPEVMREGIKVLQAIAAQGDHRFDLREALVGGAAIDATGVALPDDTRALVAEAHAVLLGAVGGPKWSDPNATVRPEQGLLALRAEMGVYANLRPVRTHPVLFGASPLRPEYLEGVDILVVRELTGGVYFGDKQRESSRASDQCVYETHEIERVVRMAGQLARERRKKVTSVDKANVMETSRLWHSTVDELFASEFADLELEHLLADAAMMHLLSRARDFDVIVTENLFGDLLTDEASMLCGSLGVLPSASLNEDRKGLFEPIHGSAPDIAGRDIANPCGMILSIAMLLRHTLGLAEDARRVDAAVYQAMVDGVGTADVAAPEVTPVGTAAMGDAIVARL